MPLANLNAAVWAIGNGLVSTTLVVFLAIEMGAAGLGISAILAAPKFAGLLRLGAPATFARFGRRKVICIVAYIFSAAVLLAIPGFALAHERSARSAALAALVLTWCIYHLLEYIGTISLWSWLGDLTPPRIRGRLLGHRERWLVTGRIGGLAASALLAVIWAILLPDAGRTQPLAMSAAAGAVLMGLATVPLMLMPAVASAPSATPRVPWRSLVRALVDPRYRRLLAFSCWFSAVNGVTAAAQDMYPVRVLGISYVGMLSLRTMMRAGQSAIAPWMGWLADRWGNRPVMMLSQCIVATGPLFFLFATPERPWIIAGAFFAWSAYAGLNVGIDNIRLKLAPADNNAPYLATYFAASDLVYGVSTIFGGLLFDRLVAGGSDALTLYTQLFILGFVGRMLAVGLLARLVEPGAKSWRDLIKTD